MRYVRLLFPLVLLLLAVPAFAACGYCGGDNNNTCIWSPGLGTRCYYEHYLCYSLCVEEWSANCEPNFSPMSSFSTDFRIVSVTVGGAKATPIKQESTVIPPKKLKKKA